MEKETVFQSNVPDEVSTLRQELAISLKFHHRNTLEKIPIEVAIQVMAEVWDACNQSNSTK